MRKAILMFAATGCAAFLAFASLILFVGIGAPTAHAAATTYNLTPLGTLVEPLPGTPGPTNTIARGINASGEVVGHSPGLSGLGAFFWNGGTTPEGLGTTLEPLGTLEGGLTSAGRGINDDGLVVGFSRIDNDSTQEQRAFLYSGGTMENLGTLPGDTSSEASAINDNEPVQIVGRSYISPSSGQAFLYSDGTMEPLRTLPGDTYSEAWAINDKGEVVGESGNLDDKGQAFLYSERAMKGLGTLPMNADSKYPYSEAMGINDSGQIVGWSYVSRNPFQGRAFLYANDKMSDLGALPGDSYSMARAIDEHGRVVGQSRNAMGINRAFLWEDNQMKDLNSLISTDDPNHPINDDNSKASSLKTLLDAYAISESGQIVGSAFNNQDRVRAFLLTPNDTTDPVTAGSVSPEPNTAGWNKTDVTVKLDATDEGGSNVEEITYSATGAQEIPKKTVEGGSVRIPITAEGETTVTFSARDHAGNDEESQTLTVRIDKTAPEISVAAPADGVEYVLGAALAAGYACSDDGSGVDTCVGPVPAGDNIDTASVGQKTFAVDAADRAGNVASESRTYSVVYDFSGFFSPVDNPDVLNTVKAGSAVPVKFTLGGDKGLDIFAKASDGGSSFPRSGKMDCDSTDPLDAIEQTVSAGSSGLTYDAATGRYTYVWKTDRDWTGCRQLVVKLSDGNTYRANFKLLK